MITKKNKIIGGYVKPKIKNLVSAGKCHDFKTVGTFECADYDTIKISEGIWGDKSLSVI